MKNREVLITGGAGFVGAHLIAALINDGYTHITAIVRPTSSLQKLQYILNLYGITLPHQSLSIARGDLTDYQFLTEQFKEKSVVFHTAAIVSFESNKDRAIISQNVLITECCTEAAIECGVERFVHLSSISTLNTPLYPEKANENSMILNLQSKSAYGISKFLSENVVRKAETRGLNCTILLPAVILGLGDAKHGGSPKLFQHLSTQQPFYTEGIMGYVGIEDVTRAMIMVSEKSEAISKRYILCSENLSFREVIAICSGANPKYKLHNNIIKLAKSILNLINNIGISTQLSSSSLDNLQEKCAYDGTKIVSEMGFTYTLIKNIQNECFRSEKCS